MLPCVAPPPHPPKGQESNVAEFAVILKMDHDGDTVSIRQFHYPIWKTNEEASL